MVVRNYWLEAKIDGRQTTLSGGPLSREGGFELTVYMRDEGEVTKPLRVRGYAGEGGKLTLHVADESGAVFHTVRTER